MKPSGGFLRHYSIKAPWAQPSLTWVSVTGSELLEKCIGHYRNHLFLDRPQNFPLPSAVLCDCGLTLNFSQSGSKAQESSIWQFIWQTFIWEKSTSIPTHYWSRWSSRFHTLNKADNSSQNIIYSQFYLVKWSKCFALVIKQQIQIIPSWTFSNKIITNINDQKTNQ